MPTTKKRTDESGATVLLDDDTGAEVVVLGAGTSNVGDIDIVSAPTGTSAIQVRITDGTTIANVQASSNALKVSDEGTVADNAVFTGGTTSIGATGYLFDTTPPVVTDGNVGVARMNSSRILMTGDADSIINLDGSGDVQVDVLSIAAGDTNIGNVDVVTLPALVAGTANIGDVDVLTLPALVAGTANIGDIDVLTMPSTADLDTGAGTDTRLTVGVVAAAAGGAVNIGGDVANGLDVDVTRLPALVAGTANIGDVDVLTLPALVAGTANIGDVDVLTLPALVAGTANIGDVDVLTLPALVAGTANIGDVDVLTLPNVTLAAGTNTNEVVGDAAHDAPIAGNPVRQGLRAVSADITAVGTGDVVDSISDLVGKQIVLPYSIPENFVSGVATLTTTSDVAVIAAGGVGIRNYITSISASNTSATNVRVDFKDGTTIVASFFVAASGGGATHIMPIPIRGTANTAFNAALSAAVTDVRVSAQGYRGI